MILHYTVVRPWDLSQTSAAFTTWPKCIHLSADPRTPFAIRLFRGLEPELQQSSMGCVRMNWPSEAGRRLPAAAMTGANPAGVGDRGGKDFPRHMDLARFPSGESISTRREARYRNGSSSGNPLEGGKLREFTCLSIGLSQKRYALLGPMH